MRAALIDPDGLVLNIILIGDDWTPPEGVTVLELTDADPIGPGWRQDGDGGWIEPDPTPPPPPTDTDVIDLQQKIDDVQAQVDVLLLDSL